MTTMAILMLIDQAKELGQKIHQTGLVTWDVSEHLKLCVDLQKQTVHYLTKPGGKAIDGHVALDDILIVTSAIRFTLANPLDKFTSQADIYNRFAVLYFAKETLQIGQNHYDNRFFIKEGHIFFKMRSGHFVFLPGEFCGKWFQLKKDISLSKLTNINQLNVRRDKKVLDILRTHVLKFR